MFTDIAQKSHPPTESSSAQRAWRAFKTRLINGLFLVLPLFITCWVIRWLYLFVESYVVSPLTALVIWKVQQWNGESPLPHWFETYATPAIGIAALLLILFSITFLAYTRLHRAVTWLLIHIPVFSLIYNPVRRVFLTLETHKDKEHGHKRPQRMVLVSFPHTGTKVPAVVTSSCRDVATGKSILCVYVPTTPMPTSGYCLLVPEDEITELNWDTEQALQTIISGGLSAPDNVSFFKLESKATNRPNGAAHGASL